ncbi:MAG: gamma-glutamyltransferase [Pseudonocardiaceae bacterium]
MNPASWNQAEVDAYLTHGIDTRDTSAVTGTGEHALVVGSTGPFAQLAGRKALQAGGSATDAVLSTALAQIALAAGSWVSYAGVFTMVHFHAATGQTESLSAGFATFAAETEPSTIPTRPQPSGRTALVPGFMAGVHAAHRRFGVLPWSELFAPAVYVAEQGFPVGSVREHQFTLRADVLARTPESREIFFSGGQPLLCRGATFRQPRLAETLRHVASQGVEWMYEGPWAREFVEVVRRDGGRVSLSDLASYRPRWAPPLRTDFHGHQVRTVGLPDRGGVALIYALNLLDEANLGDPTTDPEALYWLIQIARQTARAGAHPEREADRDHAREVWRRMREAGRFVGPGAIDPGIHSDFVLAADAHGNVAAACHSINTSLWGNTGLFAGGISIPDAACFQQHALTQLTPGEHLPFPANPAVVLRAGAPVLASSSIGAGLQVATLQGLHATLCLSMSVEQAVNRPLFHGPDYLTGDSVTTIVRERDTTESIRARINGPGVGACFRELATQAHKAGVPDEEILATVLPAIPQVVEDRFDRALLDAVQTLGQPLSIRPLDDRTLPRGFWGALSLHVEPPRLRGGRTPYSGGFVESI